MDPGWYREHYGTHLERSGLSPVDHFELHGHGNGRWDTEFCPNAWFSPWLYRRLEGGTPVSEEEHPLDHWLASVAVSDDDAAAAVVVPVYVSRSSMARAWFAIEDWRRQPCVVVEAHLCTSEFPEGVIPNALANFALAKDRVRFRWSEARADFGQSPWLSDYRGAAATTVADASRAATAALPTNGPGIIRIGDGLVGTMHMYNFWSDFEGQFVYRPRMLSVVNLHREPTALYGGLDIRAYWDERARFFDVMLSFWKHPDAYSITVPGALGYWIRPDEVTPSRQQQFGVASLFSFGKKSMEFVMDEENQKLFLYSRRYELWKRRDEIVVPKAFFASVSRGQVPGDMHLHKLPTDSKRWVFQHQFHIAMENCCQVDYMTEKLFDCFRARVVPIYWGCPNVADYFDTRGMIVVDSVDTLIEACNRLTPDLYSQMEPFLLENVKRCQELFTVHHRGLQDWKTRRLAAATTSSAAASLQQQDGRP